MFENIVRDNIKELQAYSCAREEFDGVGVVLLDANENPFDTGYNRYPDPYQRELKGMIAGLKGVEVSRLVLGNGSDELIDILIRTVCVPGVDNVIVFSPGYSMYEVSAKVNDVEVRRLDLDADFMPEWDRLPSFVDVHTKLIFFCTPNNPVGNVLPLERIRQVARWFEGLVVVDEAYIDFTDALSAIGLWDTCENVVVLQTLSKAWGLAGLRVGICMAHPGLVAFLNKVKPPYNIGVLPQSKALEVLRERDVFQVKVEEIKRERQRVVEALREIPVLNRVYTSEANFVLVCSSCYRQLYAYLVEQGIVVRVRHVPPRLVGGLRITIGTPEENDRLIGKILDFK